jgi:hypothetical protein
MMLEYPAELRPVISELHKTHEVETHPREELKGGVSGAHVYLVDAQGRYDRIFILKTDLIPDGYEDEEARYRTAQKQGAFGGKILKVIASARIAPYYSLLLSLAGGTRIEWRPLIESLGLFGGAYARLAGILWTPELISLSREPVPADAVLRIWLDYMLSAERGGRIHHNLSSFGADLSLAPTFLHLGQELPNPLYFCSGGIPSSPIINTFSGPFHGDCHALNVFCKTGLSGSVLDISLIDLASFRSDAPLFFDCAYFELATLLRMLQGLGEDRWFRLADALANDEPESKADQEDRGWIHDIREGRTVVLSKARKSYRNRADDIITQFLLAHVGAGLAFLNKRLTTGGEGGLSFQQFQQAFVWSACFLKSILKRLRVPTVKTERNIPVLPTNVTIAKRSLSDTDWASVKRFDRNGLNILVLPPGGRRENHLKEVFRLDWTLVVDFETQPFDANENFGSLLFRPVRWVLPHGPEIDAGSLGRTAAWYFANGRSDVSDCKPAESLRGWRQTYLVCLQEILGSIATRLAPSSVRLLIFGEFSNVFVRSHGQRDS